MSEVRDKRCLGAKACAVEQLVILISLSDVPEKMDFLLIEEVKQAVKREAHIINQWILELIL